MVADSFRLLPTEAEGKSIWTATEWAEKRQGWIFITSRPAMREALRPLISLWIDILVLRLLTEPHPDQKRVWFVIDELASLQRLPQLHTAITENRKAENPVILGFQGRSQLEDRYGTMPRRCCRSRPPKSCSAPASRAPPDGSAKPSVKSKSSGCGRRITTGRAPAGTSLSTGRRSRWSCIPKSPASTDLHAFLKYGNHVTRFSFPYLDAAKDQVRVS